MISRCTFDHYNDQIDNLANISATMVSNHNRSWFLGLVVICVFACQSSNNIPDVSLIEVKPELIRYEQILSSLDLNDPDSTAHVLSSEYQDFTEVFFFQIVTDSRAHGDLKRSVQLFLQDSFIQVVMQDCEDQFASFDHYFEDLKNSFKYFKHYFPDYPTPDIYTCVSGFEVGAFTIGDNILGIGLDFYLGSDYSKYDPLLFPNYIKRTMDSKHLVAKSIQALIANYLGEARGTQLLDFMIRNGVELYIKSHLLPHEEPEIIHEFTPEQLSWCHDNESEIWAHLLAEELLYSNNYRKFQKLVTPSPNVPNMPPEAPGRVGNWIGFRIVEAYMGRHPQTSLGELISFTEAQKILAESKYKPRQ